MIGQNDLLKRVDDLIKNDKYPRFLILVGRKGSGKKLICDHIYENLNIKGLNYVKLDSVKVDSIRDMIARANKLQTHCLYVIPDADTMSISAKNTLLKVTEEPPNNSYFIMTVQDENLIPATIKSRGVVLHVDPYTPEEIAEYAKINNTDDLKIITDVCEVPGDVDILKALDPVKFYSFVELVVQSIADVSGANSFKIANKINLKDEPEKYDMRLFWRAFMVVCLDKIHDDTLKYATAVRVTSKYLNDLRVSGINKGQLFDMWILNIREIWM